MIECITGRGFITATVKYKSGKIHTLSYKNQLLNSGKGFLTKCLLEGAKPHITNILFGDGGTASGQPKEVVPTQEGLNGVVRLRKPVIAQIDPESPNQAIFSTVLGEQEGNGFTINEMALEMSDEKLFSLSTFLDFNKTSDIESIGYCWFVVFI